MIINLRSHKESSSSSSLNFSKWNSNNIIQWIKAEWASRWGTGRLKAALTRTNERTNEVYLPMNRVNNDRLPVKAEAHQSWPPKNKEKRQSNNTKTTEKRKKEKYIVIHKITPEKNTKKTNRH